MTPHPLDPLSADEIRAAAGILRRDRDVGERWRFASIELREPSKAIARGLASGDPIRREAVAVCWNRDDGAVYKARVALTDDRVVAWEHQPDGQPNMTLDEFHDCDAAMGEYAPHLDVDGDARHRPRDRSPGALPIGPRQPCTAWRSCSARRRCAPSRRGKQDYDWSAQRAWKVVNERVANGLGTPVG